MKTDIKNEIKKVLKHAPVYGLGAILSQLVGFLLIPVYTRFLTTADYGVLNLVVLTADVIGIVASLKAGDTMIRFYYESRDVRQRNLVVSTIIFNIIFFGMLILLPLYLLSNYFSQVILNDSDFGYLFQMAFTSMMLNMLFSIAMTYIQIQEKSIKFVTLSLTKLLMAVSLNIYFVVVLKIGVFGIVLSTLITSIIFTLITIPLLIKKVGFKFSLYWTKQLLRFGLPFIPSTLANKASHASDRYFLKFYLTMSQVGIYSLGYRLGAVIHNIFNVSLFRVLNVRIMAIHKEDNAPQVIAKLASYSLMFLCFLGLGISIFSKDIVMLMTPETYWDAAKIIPPITLCYIIFASESFAIIPIIISKKTERLSAVNLICGLLNIGLNFIFIPRFGINGAVLVTLITFSLKIVSIYFVGAKLYPIPFQWMRLMNIIIISVCLYLVSIFFAEFSVCLRFFSKMTLCFLFIPLLWMCGIVNNEEKTEIKQMYAIKSFLI